MGPVPSLSLHSGPAASPRACPWTGPLTASPWGGPPAQPRGRARRLCLGRGGPWSHARIRASRHTPSQADILRRPFPTGRCSVRCPPPAACWSPGPGRRLHPAGPHTPAARTLSHTTGPRRAAISAINTLCFLFSVSKTLSRPEEGYSSIYEQTGASRLPSDRVSLQPRPPPRRPPPPNPASSVRTEPCRHTHADQHAWGAGHPLQGRGPLPGFSQPLSVLRRRDRVPHPPPQPLPQRSPWKCRRVSRSGTDPGFPGLCLGRISHPGRDRWGTGTRGWVLKVVGKGRPPAGSGTRPPALPVSGAPRPGRAVSWFPQPASPRQA